MTLLFLFEEEGSSSFLVDDICVLVRASCGCRQELGQEIDGEWNATVENVSFNKTIHRSHRIDRVVDFMIVFDVRDR